MAYTALGDTRERVWCHMRDQLLAGRPPMVREVQRHFGFQAIESTRQYLETLVAEGRLSKEEGKARGYRLPGPGAAAKVLVPLIGRVAAGGLQELIEDPKGYLPIEGRRPARPGVYCGRRERGEKPGALPDGGRNGEAGRRRVCAELSRIAEFPIL